MRRIVTGFAVLGLVAGAAMVIGAGAGAGRGSCPMHSTPSGEAREACPHSAGAWPKLNEGGCCAVREGHCPKGASVAECPKAAKAACCEACPLKADCPKAGQAGCCEACPVAKGEVKPAGCPLAAPAAVRGGCGMHAASGCGHAAAVGEEVE